ncbi:MAG: hypothetical protein NUK57_02545 [Gudongella sp.]|nr:hypothetical protein [Gudongella sp.]
MGIVRDDEVIVTLGQPTDLHYVNDSGFNALTTEITIDGALFNANGGDSSYWDLDLGTTDLGLLDMLVSPDAASIRIRFLNEPSDGTIEFKLLGGGNTEGVDTNTVTLDVFAENDGGYISSGTNDWVYTTHSTTDDYPGYNEEVGTMSWRTNRYENSMTISLTTQPIDKPDSDMISIEWMQANLTESGFDYVRAYYSFDEESWFELSSYYGFSNWDKKSFVVANNPFEESIVIKWEFKTDGSVIPLGGSVYIDNLSIHSVE